MKIFAFINQGSDNLKLLAEQVSYEASGGRLKIIRGRTIGIIKLVSVYDFLRVIWGCIKLSRKYKGTKVESAIVDKALRYAVYYRCIVSLFYKIYWYFVAALMKNAEIYKSADCILSMDDVYGGSLLIDIALCDGKIVLTNFSGVTGGFLMLKDKDILTDYKNKSNWEFKMPAINNARAAENIMDAIIYGKSSQKDYSRAHDITKKRFIASKSNMIKLLVAGHIFTDASSSHQMSFNSFEEWLKFILNEATKNKNIEIYVKEHPSYELYSEQGRMRNFLKNWSNITFISGDLKIDYLDFDLIVSNNGSIIYEAIYCGVPCLSTSVGFSGNLRGVKTIYDRMLISEFISKLQDLDILQLRGDIFQNIFWNKEVINDWFLRRYLFCVDDLSHEEIIKHSKQFAGIINEFINSKESIANIINTHDASFSPKLVYLK